MKCNTNSPAGSRDHILVQPKQPCRGVEEWRTDNCGRESIWCVRHLRAAAAAKSGFHL